ncbi:MAG: hypothetical protein ACKO9S_07305, partial [Bacteroidota bacterium]
LNDLKEENVDLNDHIYSIDVFMREKDQQCDQLQKENQEHQYPNDRISKIHTLSILCPLSHIVNPRSSFLPHQSSIVNRTS